MHLPFSNNCATSGPLEKSLGGPITGLLLVGLVGVTTKVAAMFEMTDAIKPEHRLGLSLAAEAELKYLDGVIDFEEPPEGIAAAPSSIELTQLAVLFDFSKVLIVVACNATGAVVSGHNLRDVEIGRLIRARDELAHLAASIVDLKGVPGIPGPQ